MIYKNRDHNRYRINFMRVTEALMDRLTVKEFIQYLEERAVFEDYDVEYIDGEILNSKVYALYESNRMRKEFIVTENGRLFYWVSLIRKAELIDNEQEDLS